MTALLKAETSIASFFEYTPLVGGYTLPLYEYKHYIIQMYMYMLEVQFTNFSTLQEIIET